MSPIPSAVVTGASGFIGRRLMARLGAVAVPLPLAAEGWEARLAAAPLRGAVVFHLAARVHRIDDRVETAFHRDNVEKTVALAQAARRAGARAFVFASTVKVLGEESSAPLVTGAPYAPQDAYARSKQAAEVALLDACAGTLPLTIVRFPLVYGAGATGNVARLLRLCDSPMPLPFGAVRNRRSWVHVDDLADLFTRCAARIPEAGGILHAAHPQPASTSELVTALRRALGRPARLVPVPVAWLEAAAAIAGAREPMRRLTRSLELDARETYRRCEWEPRFDLAGAAADIAAKAA